MIDSSNTDDEQNHPPNRQVRSSESNGELLVTGSVVVTIGILASALALLVNSLVLARAIGTFGVGYYSFVLRVFAVIVMLVGLSSSTTIAYLTARARESDDISRAIRDGILICGPLSIMGAILLIVFAPAIGNSASLPLLSNLLMLISIAIPTNTVYLIIINTYRGLQRFRIYAAGIAAHPIIWLLVNIIDTVLFHLSVEGVIFNYTGTTVVLMVTTVALSRKLWRGKPSNKTARLSYIRMGVPLTIVAVMFSWIEGVGIFALGYLTGDAEIVGIYANAFSLAIYLRFLVEPLGVAALPIMARYNSKGHQHEAQVSVDVGIGIILTLFTPICLIASVLSREILEILYPLDFITGNVTLSLVALGMPAFGIYALLNKVLIAHDDSKSLAKILVVSAIAITLLTLILVPHFHMIGAAMAIAITYAIMATVTYKHVKRHGIAIGIRARRIGLIVLFFACISLAYVAAEFVGASFAFQGPLISVFIVFLVSILFQLIAKPLSLNEGEFLLILLRNRFGLSTDSKFSRALRLFINEKLNE